MIAKGKTRITITLSNETLEKLKLQCKNEKRTLSQIIDDSFRPWTIEEKLEIAHSRWLDE